MKKIIVYVDDDDHEEFVETAEKLKMKRSELARTLILEGIKQIQANGLQITLSTAKRKGGF